MRWPYLYNGSPFSTKCKRCGGAVVAQIWARKHTRGGGGCFLWRHFPNKKWDIKCFSKTATHSFCNWYIKEISLQNFEITTNLEREAFLYKLKLSSFKHLKYCINFHRKFFNKLRLNFKIICRCRCRNRNGFCDPKSSTSLTLHLVLQLRSCYWYWSCVRFKGQAKVK